jgi:hypothetical protein
VMPGATNQTTLGGEDGSTMTSYKVAKTADEVRKFYNEQMPAKGWSAKESAVDTMLPFAKAGREVQVMISAESDGCSVMLIVRLAAADTPATQATEEPAPTSAPEPTAEAAPTEGPAATEEPAPTEEPTPNLVGDIPLMAGATVTERGGDYLIYTVTSPLVDVVTFYQTELTGVGWLLDDASEDGTYMLFSKEGRMATFDIAEADGQTTVSVTVAQP